MNKKVMSFILAMVMCFSLRIPAMALDAPSVDPAPSVEVVNLSDDITAQALQEIVSSTCAYTIQEDGTAIPVDSVITIEDVSLAQGVERMSSDQKAYQITLSTTFSSENEKEVSDYGDKDSSIVQATAELKMVWVDGPGLSNYIKTVRGSRTVTKGSVTSAVVGWKEFSSPRNMVKKDVTTIASFYYNCQEYLCVKPTAFYEIHFSGDSFSIYLQTTASVFQ